MSDDNLPASVMSSTVTIMGVELVVHVLGNGQRIIEADGFNRFFEAMASGGEISPDDAMKFAKISKGIIE